MKATLASNTLSASLRKEYTTDIVEGIVDFSGNITEYILLSGNPNCQGVKRYEFTLFIGAAPAGTVFNFDDGSDAIRCVFYNVDNIEFDCENAWSPTYDITAFKGLKAECVIEVNHNRIGASCVNYFTINGVTQTQSGIFGSSTIAGTSRIGQSVNGAGALDNCEIWNIKQYDNLGVLLHDWSGQPNGELDAAWVDNTGVLNGTVQGTPSTTSRTFGGTTEANLPDPHLKADILSEQFGATFDYRGLEYGNEPVPIGNQVSSLITTTNAALRLQDTVEIEFDYYYFDTQNWSAFPIAVMMFYNVATNFLKINIDDNTTDLYITGRVNGVLLQAPASGFTINNFFDTVPGWYKIKITWSATSMKVYKDNVLQTTEVVEDLNNMVQAGGKIIVMDDDWIWTPVPAGHSVRNVKYTTNGALVAQYPICEESGNTAYNVVSNAYHLTGQNGFNAITWERNVTTDKYLKDYGYRLDTGVYIPSLLSQVSAADGNALTNVPPNTEFN